MPMTTVDGIAIDCSRLARAKPFAGLPIVVMRVDGMIPPVRSINLWFQRVVAHPAPILLDTAGHPFCLCFLG